MQIYHYSHKTGEYIGTGVADESPLEPGVWLIPANATSIPPLQPLDGHIVTFMGDAWEYIPVTPPPPEPEPTEAEILATMKSAIQGYLDTKPKEREYDGILSLCTYATSTNPKFAAEGQAGVEWRDAVWAKSYEIMAAVKAGERPIPTKEELLAEMPVFKWPDEI